MFFFSFLKPKAVSVTLKTPSLGLSHHLRQPVMCISKLLFIFIGVLSSVLDAGGREKVPALILIS